MQVQSQRQYMKQNSSKYHSQNFNTINLATMSGRSSKNPQAISVCLNHQQKRATYLYCSSQNNQQMPYCEKCAIMLASQGFSIIKIDLSKGFDSGDLCAIDQSASERHEEIQKFIDELSIQIDQLSSKYSKAEYSLRLSEEHFNNLIQQTIKYFEQIQDLIQVQKFIALNAILSQRTELQRELRLTRASLISEIQTLTGFKDDITNNLEAVESVEEAIYESIMDNYTSKFNISLTYNHLDFRAFDAVKPAIVLPSIPALLYSLSDNIHLRNQQRESIKYVQTERMPRDSITQRTSKSRSSWGERKNNQLNNSIPERRMNSIKSLKKCNQKANWFVKSLQTRNIDRQDQMLYSQQQVFRNITNLPQIQQNESELHINTDRKNANLFLQESIPEQMVNTSHESFPEYYDSETLGYNPADVNSEEDAPESMLLF